ncbi:MAG TPA: peptidylprolyl isomerase [Ktedonobacteraceae bacterium]|nr:peptidylprolyl isomerase [Ktedonobacteraceae bacterium]
MNSQTARRPASQRPNRTAKTKKYVKQTAHVEARRDGKPLIFGWGGHLSHSEKTRIQRRAVWAFTALVSLLIIAVIVGYWVNINVIVPNLPITSVNGQPIPQSDFRKLVAVKAQIELNKIYGQHGMTAQRDSLRKQGLDQQKVIDDATKQVDALNKQIQALPAGPSAQRTNLQNQLTAAKKQVSDATTKRDSLNSQYNDMLNNTIPQEQQLYTQDQVGSESANWLQDDALIRQWLVKQPADIRAKIEPTASAINGAIHDFVANFPTSTTYDKFLSDDNISDADVHTMFALIQRRNNMQTYQASLINSPARQVHARMIVLSTPADANSILKQLQQPGADFGKLAKAKSTDTSTSSKNGDLGWLARGQYAQNDAANISGLADNWIFDPARKVNEISPVLTENGTYRIIQITGIDPARAIDATTLKSLKDNALTAWLLEQKALPGVKVSSIDQNKLLDPLNMPPGLPSAAPAVTPPAGGVPGAPGGVPGIPGGNIPGTGP